MPSNENKVAGVKILDGPDNKFYFYYVNMKLQSQIINQSSLKPNTHQISSPCGYRTIPRQHLQSDILNHNQGKKANLKVIAN